MKVNKKWCRITQSTISTFLVGQGPGQHDQGLVLDNAVEDEAGGLAGVETYEL